MASLFGKLFAPKPSAAKLPESFAAVYAEALGAAAAQDFQRAIPLYEQAIALDPAHAEAWYKLGNALKNVGRLEEAIASYDRAIEARPDYAHAYCNRGTVLQGLGRMEAALTSYERASALDPNDALAHYNRALLLQECSRWDEVIPAYDRAIALNPNHAEAHFNRSLAALFLGDFAAGWRGHEWRWPNAERLGIGAPRPFVQPLWLGAEALAGRRLLLHAEAGLGDTIQFCRYATACAQRGATVLLEVQSPLVDLLGTLEGVAQVIAAGSPLPPFDLHCPLMSLPLAFATTLENIPAADPYLRADEKRVAQWRARLGDSRRPRIGLTWSGNPNNPIDARRSIPLSLWVRYLPRDCEYFCLQFPVRDADRAALEAAPWIRTFSGDEISFANTAALCECLDLVISVDTSVAHLAAALGRPTWVLLPLMPDWRWLKDREDSPWYPSARLFRQRQAGDWREVIGRVTARIHDQVSGAGH